MNGANMDEGPAEEPKVWYLKHNPALTIEEARENAQEVKDRITAMLGEASGIAAAGRYVRDWQAANKAAMTRGWVKVLKTLMPDFLKALRSANLRGTLQINVAEKGKSFDLLRGEDKGTTREWKFASNEGKKKREKKPRGAAICKEFGVK